MHTIKRPIGYSRAGLAAPSTVAVAEAGRGGRVLKTILWIALGVVKWLAIALLVALVGVLVLLSCLAGPMALLIALMLAAVWFGLLGLLGWAARHAHAGRVLVVTVLGFLTLGLLTVGISQASAYTPAIVDAQGQVVPGSIATLEKVNLNGSNEWISIRGRSASAPVLLFLAGGPGGSQLGSVRRTLRGLEDHFVVVNWEQPGSGKSFDAVDRATLTPDRYVADAHALILYLRQRFGAEKVYLLGESFGSALGIMIAQRYPDLVYAFMGTGQMVAFTATDQMCYDFALRWAQERGDSGKVAQLQAQGPPPYYGDDVGWKEANYLLDTFGYMNDDPAIYHTTDTISDLLTPEYGLYDKVNWLRGPLDTLNHVYPQLWTVDFRQQATRLAVPVYFLIGRHDINAPVVLTEQYYQILDAPHKEIVWFEHSGHSPWDSEQAAFVDTIVTHVLPATYQR